MSDDIERLMILRRDEDGRKSIVCAKELPLEWLRGLLADRLRKGCLLDAVELTRHIEARQAASQAASQASQERLTYEEAKAEVERAQSLRECTTWLTQLHVLTKMACKSEDEALKRYAHQIRQQVYRRCGELLAALPERAGERSYLSLHSVTVTRSEAARRVGISEGLKARALELAAIPKATFDAAVAETGEPPEAA